MNYRCRKIQSMIDRYESTNNAGELISGLKGYIAEYGGIYDVTGISKDLFDVHGYNTESLSEATIEKIADKIDIGDCLIDAMQYWADHFGVPKIEENNQSLKSLITF